MNPVFDESFFQDLLWKSPWVTDREEYILSTLCGMLDDAPELGDSEEFISCFDNALLIFAVFRGRWDYDTNRKLIYNRQVRDMLLRYRSDGLDFLKSLIYEVKNGVLMRQAFPITSNPLNLELLDIIRLNDAEACLPQILDHLIANGIFDDKWRRSVSRDIHSVRQGRKDWEWFYTRYKDAPKKYEPCFDDPVVRTVWRAFRKFRKSGGKG